MGHRLWRCTPTTDPAELPTGTTHVVVYDIVHREALVSKEQSSNAPWDSLLGASDRLVVDSAVHDLVRAIRQQRPMVVLDLSWEVPDAVVDLPAGSVAQMVRDMAELQLVQGLILPADHPYRPAPELGLKQFISLERLLAQLGLAKA